MAGRGLWRTRNLCALVLTCSSCIPPPAGLELLFKPVGLACGHKVGVRWNPWIELLNAWPLNYMCLALHSRLGSNFVCCLHAR